FGQFMTGASGPGSAAAGWAYHVSNGWTFGIAYAVVAGPARWWWGIAWAMLLELAMLLVYPVLFQIRYVEPFIAVSVTGHVLYGSVLGLWCRRYAVRWRRGAVVS
ncbi:MAG TPA: hypothetical protein VFE14_11190, partial [Micromonosporaceae bacterium]|nr:hypothetical protein [Micromonosporaceae bacterium]